MRVSRRLAFAMLASSAALAACGNPKSASNSGTDGGIGAAAGAPNEGPPDTLFQDDVLNEIDEGNYFLTGEGDGVTELSFLSSFREATHVELTLQGGSVDSVQGVPVDDEESSFDFEVATRRSATHDFSAGNYRLLFVARDVAGEFRLDLDATPLAGSEL